MTRLNISIVLLFILLSSSCQKACPKTFFFIYEDNRFGSKRYFKIEKRTDVNNREIRLYHDHLDRDFVSTVAPRPILFKKNKNTLSYLFYQFPLNRKKIDSCHAYEYYIEKDRPPFVYKSCLIRNVIDTVINNISVKNASLYKLIPLDSRIDKTDLNVIFDWDREIFIEEKSIEFNIKLIRVDSNTIQQYM